MEYAKTILCLANSWKPGGRCIAGRERTEHGLGGWIRPVSAREDEAISLQELQYNNGGSAEVLDVLTATFQRAIPKDYQTENHLIAARPKWEKVGIARRGDLQSAIDQFQGPLWLNGQSSKNGNNDRIPELSAATLNTSLCLIQPDSLRILVRMESAGFANSKRNVRGEFTFDGCNYLLSITDPKITTQYLAKENGEYVVSPIILCVSLGKLFHGFVYKLIATVITDELAS